MVTRSALPQNYVISAGNLVLDLEDPALMTMLRGSAEADTINFLSGTQSVKLSHTGSGTEYMSAGFDIPATVFQNRAFILHVYVHNVAAFSYGRVYAASVSSLSKYALSNMIVFRAGWNDIRINANPRWEILYNGEVLTNPTIRVQLVIYPVDGQHPVISVDSIARGSEGMCRAVLTFDDNWSSQYTEAFAYMQPRGIRGTCYLASGYTNPDYHITLEQKQEMYADGWAMCPHTTDHTYLDTVSIDVQRAKIQPSIDYLIDNGMPRAAYHFAYPGGRRNADTLSLMTELGIKTARTVDTAEVCDPMPDMRLVPTAFNLINTTTAESVFPGIDAAIRSGSTIFFLAHQIVETPVGVPEVSIDVFQQVIDYLVQKRVPCVTIDEWYNGLTNPRYRSLPVGRT